MTTGHVRHVRKRWGMGEYERWESRFSGDGHLFGTAPNAFLKAQQSRLPKTGRALAVADGQGRNGVWLAEQGLDVVSMDFSPTAHAGEEHIAIERLREHDGDDVVRILRPRPIGEVDLLRRNRNAARGREFARLGLRRR
jgi:hypothetical protein